MRGFFISRIRSSIVKRWYIWLILFVTAAAAFGFYSTNKTHAEEETIIVRKETIKDYLALSGQIDAEEKAILHFQTGGKVNWVNVKEGDQVKKYDGIASLDQRQLEKQIDKYLNTYAKTRLTFDQTEDDNDSLTLDLSREVREAAERTLDKSQYDLNNSVLDVEIQTIAKEYAYLYSPINGIVVRADIEHPGVNASIADQWVVINPDSLFFSISADQTEVVQMYEGMRGEISIDAFSDLALSGTVTDIAFIPKSNETGTVYEVKMALPGSLTEGFRLGMTGDVEFVIHEIPDIVTIPLDAIIEDDGEVFVEKKIAGKKERVEVVLGEEYDGDVEVIEGVFEGDEIYLQLED